MPAVSAANGRSGGINGLIPGGYPSSGQAAPAQMSTSGSAASVAASGGSDKTIPLRCGVIAIAALAILYSMHRSGFRSIITA